MNLATFRSLRPEFLNVPDAVVQTRLDQAAARMNTAAWGAVYDEGHELLTCHILAGSPYGNAAGMVTEAGVTIYWPLYEALKRSAAGTAFVTNSGLPCP